MNRISRGYAFRPKTLMLLIRFSFLILSSAAIMTLALESSKFSRKKRYSTLFHTVLGMSSDSKVKKSTKPTQDKEKRSHSYPPGNKTSKHGKLQHLQVRVCSISFESSDLFLFQSYSWKWHHFQGLPCPLEKYHFN